MPLTTTTSRSLAVGFTQQTLYNEIRAAMLAAGFTIFDENGSAGSNMQLVCSTTFNGTTKGTAFLSVTIATNFAITAQIFDGFNATTNTGANGSVVWNVGTLGNASSALRTITLNGSEMRGITLSGAALTGINPILLVRPENKPSWWDENLFPYFFLQNTQNGVRGCNVAVQPPAAATTNANHGYASEIGSGFSGINVSTNQPDAYPIGHLLIRNASNNMSLGGFFSNDIIRVQETGLIHGDSLVFNGNIWTYTHTGIAVRSGAVT